MTSFSPMSKRTQMFCGPRQRSDFPLP